MAAAPGQTVSFISLFHLSMLRLYPYDSTIAPGNLLPDRSGRISTAVGLSNILESKVLNELNRGELAKRSHWDIVGTGLMLRELGAKVSQREESTNIIESLLIFSVATLDLAIVPGCIGPNEFVFDAERSSGCIKQCRDFALGVREAVGELKAIVSLDTLNPNSQALIEGDSHAQEVR